MNAIALSLLSSDLASCFVFISSILSIVAVLVLLVIAGSTKLEVDVIANSDTKNIAAGIEVCERLVISNACIFSSL